MNAKLRNDIITVALEADDSTDDTYILPGKSPTYRVAYDESEWKAGKKVKIGSIEWTHPETHTIITCNPVLIPKKVWSIDNCDCEITFRKSCDVIIDELTAYLTSQGI